MLDHQSNKQITDQALDETAVASDSPYKVRSMSHGLSVFGGGLFTLNGSKISEGFNEFKEALRYDTQEAAPAWFINHSTQVNMGFRTAANLLSMYSGYKFASPDRLIASSIELAGVGAGTLINQKPQTVEEEERLKNMPYSEYAFTRLKQAFDPMNHIVQTAGMTTIVGGILMARSGYRKGGIEEAITGVMTSAAGSSFLFSQNQEIGHQLGNAIFFTRAPISAAHGYRAFFKGNPAKGVPPGDWMIPAKWGVNQSANLVGFTLAGAHKDADGNIISVSTGTQLTDDGRVVDEESTLDEVAAPGTTVGDVQAADVAKASEVQR